MDPQTARGILAAHKPTPWWLPPWPRQCRVCRQQWCCDAANLANATLHPPMPPEWYDRPAG